MIKILSQNGNISYDIYEYVVDLFSELATLTHCGMGSKAYVIENSATYILDGNGEWIKKPVAENGSAEGGAEYDDTELRELIQENTDRITTLTDLTPEDLDTLKEVADKLTEIDNKVNDIDTMTEDEVNAIIETQLTALTTEEIDTLFGGNAE